MVKELHRQEWCIKYMKKMRKILMKKFDSVSSKVLEYIEQFIVYTEEEKLNLPAS